MKKIYLSILFLILSLPLSVFPMWKRTVQGSTVFRPNPPTTILGIQAVFLSGSNFSRTASNSTWWGKTYNKFFGQVKENTKISVNEYRPRNHYFDSQEEKNQSFPYKNFVKKEQSKFGSFTSKGYIKQEPITKDIILETVVTVTREPYYYTMLKTLKDVASEDKLDFVSAALSRVTDQECGCEVFIQWLNTPLDENRGKGYATILLQSIEKDAREAGCSKLVLKSVPLAKKLYERHNFITVGPIDDSDLTLMYKELLKESSISL